MFKHAWAELAHTWVISAMMVVSPATLTNLGRIWRIPLQSRADLANTEAIDSPPIRLNQSHIRPTSHEWARFRPNRVQHRPNFGDVDILGPGVNRPASPDLRGLPSERTLARSMCRNPLRPTETVARFSLWKGRCGLGAAMRILVPPSSIKRSRQSTQLYTRSAQAHPPSAMPSSLL